MKKKNLNLKLLRPVSPSHPSRGPVLRLFYEPYISVKEEQPKANGAIIDLPKAVALELRVVAPSDARKREKDDAVFRILAVTLVCVSVRASFDFATKFFFWFFGCCILLLFQPGHRFGMSCEMGFFFGTLPLARTHVFGCCNFCPCVLHFRNTVGPRESEIDKKHCADFGCHRAGGEMEA